MKPSIFLPLFLLVPAALSGAAKEKESLTALLRARSVLRQKYGTAYVTFAEPISLEQALGDRKEDLRSSAPAAEPWSRWKKSTAAATTC